MVDTNIDWQCKIDDGLQLFARSLESPNLSLLVRASSTHGDTLGVLLALYKTANLETFKLLENDASRHQICIDMLNV